MTNSSNDIIPEILKLYDMAECPMMLNNTLLLNTPEHGHNHEESSCNNSLKTDTHQLVVLLNKAKECSLECFVRLHSHLSVLLEGTGFKMGFERKFGFALNCDLKETPFCLYASPVCHIECHLNTKHLKAML